MPLTSNDYTDNLFGAIDAIVEERLKHLSFDKTTIVEIVDNKFAFAGTYTVTHDGSFNEKAHSDSPNYKIGDKVYMLTPSGSSRKFIIGLYQAVNTKPRIITATGGTVIVSNSSTNGRIESNSTSSNQNG